MYCSTCGTEMDYVDQYHQYFCTKCRKYQQAPPPPPPPPQYRPPPPAQKEIVFGVIIAIITIIIVVVVAIVGALYISGTFDNPDRKEVHVICSTSWSGTIADSSSSKEVSNYDGDIFEVEGGTISATIQKDGGGNARLTVKIIKDGETYAMESLTEEYGTVSVSYTF